MHRQQFMMKARPTMVQPKRKIYNEPEDSSSCSMSNDGSRLTHTEDKEESYSGSSRDEEFNNFADPNLSDNITAKNEHAPLISRSDEGFDNGSQYSEDEDVSGKSENDHDVVANDNMEGSLSCEDDDQSRSTSYNSKEKDSLSYGSVDNKEIHDGRSYSDDDNRSYNGNDNQFDPSYGSANEDKDNSYRSDDPDDPDRSFSSRELDDGDNPACHSGDSGDDHRSYNGGEYDVSHSSTSGREQDENRPYSCSDVEDVRSKVSPNQHGDRPYDDGDQDDSRSYDGGEQHVHGDQGEDASYDSGDQDDDGGEQHVHGDQGEDASYDSGDQDDDRSYISGDQDDSRSRDHSGGVDDRSYASDDPEEDHSYASADHSDSGSHDNSHAEEDRSYASGDQEDDRSYISGNHNDNLSYDRSDAEDNRSYVSGDQDSHHSFVGGAHNDNRSYDRSNAEDDHSYVSGDQEDDRSYISGGHDDNRSCDRSYAEDDHSYVSGDLEDDRSHISGDQYEDRAYDRSDAEDDRSYVSGDEDDDHSYISGDHHEDRSCHRSDLEDEEDNRSNSSVAKNEEDNFEDPSSEHDENCSYESGEHSDDGSSEYDDGNMYDKGDENDDRSYDANADYDDKELLSPNLDEPESDNYHSSESMPTIELDEESDDSYHSTQSGFHRAESTFASKENKEVETSDNKRTFRQQCSADKANSSSCRVENHLSNSDCDENSGHYDDEYCPGMGDEVDTCNGSSLNDFDSFAYDASVASMKHQSNHSEPQIGVGVECNDDAEDVSVLSLLPADTCANTATNHSLNESVRGRDGSTNAPHPSNLYARMGMSNPLDEPSVASSYMSTTEPTKSIDKLSKDRISQNLLLPQKQPNKSDGYTYHPSDQCDSDAENIYHLNDESESAQSQSNGSHMENQHFTDESRSHSHEAEENESESSFGGSGSFAGDETLESQQLMSDKTHLILSKMNEDDDGDGPEKFSDDSSKSDEVSEGASIPKSGSASTGEPTGSSLRLPKPKTYGGYTREQISRLIDRGKSAESGRFRRRKDLLGQGKSDSLIEFAVNVHSAMEKIDQGGEHDEENPIDTDVLSTSSRLLHAFEVLVGIFLQLSDELELLQTFANGKGSPAIETIESLFCFSKPLDDNFKILQSILLHHLTSEIDEELDDFLYGMNLVVDLLCELSHRVGEKQIWNARANNAFVTLLELLARDTLEVSCIYEDVDTPEYELTDLIHDAWEATGHIEEVKTLLVTDDLFMFRQICYEVILSTDQWCPDSNVLMDICGIDNTPNNKQFKPEEDDILSSPPEAALQILEKIHGEPLPRTATLASILRRLLPPNVVADPSISENFARIRSTIRNPVGIPPSSLVTITSIPESWNDPDALGVAGVGKSTLAAMVANHSDVRRYFNDGIAWIYVGEIELNYNRYVQCLQDLLSQLQVDEDEEPLFPELLHIPGESQAMRKRREEGFMIYLRETLVEFLRFRNVLIILDDVCFEPDLDWFDFAPAPPEHDEDEEDEGSCAILMTSRRRNLLPPADTVEVDMLEEADGIKLLVRESGELSLVIEPDAAETKSVVRECACHPLTIKSVGRWLNLKHATSETVENTLDMRDEVFKSMNKILKGELHDSNDTMYEILSMSLSPAINDEPTAIIKFCFAAFVRVFCDRKHISDFALADSTPIVPMASAELLFQSLLDLEKETLLQEGSAFYEQRNEAAKLIPEALASLGIFKVIITYTEAPEDSSQNEEEDEKYLQIMHRIQQEYGEYLYEEDVALTDLTRDGERRWNKAFAKAFMIRDVAWDTEAPDAGLDYGLEMLPSHMMRGGLLLDTARLLRNEKFIRGRLSVLGRENGSRRHIKDCEALFDLMVKKRASDQKKVDPKGIIRSAYEALGSLLKMGEDEFIEEEGSPEAVEVGRCHYEIGFSLAERRCWEGAISHWELSQEFLVSSLGMVELVAGLLYNIAVVNTEMHEYELALGSLKQCLRIRGAIHGEEHILYAQTIQKIGDVFLAMSDYQEAMESYDWALDVMHIEPSHHRINIGDTLEQIGKIHYSKGEIEDSLQSYQDALRSKQIDLGEDHPELAQIFHQIGNCLSNMGKTDEAIAHLEEAIRLKKLDPTGGCERDSDVLTIEGILSNLNCKQKEGLECYEKALQILVTKAPHKKEKVAALLHLIGCVYLMSGEHKKALKLFEESLYARRKVLGFVHLDVASTFFVCDYFPCCCEL
jgi:tetratricopeptide (TPR) repeat protein